MSFWGATVITSMVTAIPLAGQPIVQWLWGGFTVAKCGIGSYSFSCIFSRNADPIVGSKIEFNHSLFDGCAGSKNFSMTFECINFYICLILQTDKLKLMNLSVSENVLLIQKFNWQSVYGLNSSLFLYDKIGVIVLICTFCGHICSLSGCPIRPIKTNLFNFKY